MIVSANRDAVSIRLSLNHQRGDSKEAFDRQTEGFSREVAHAAIGCVFEHFAVTPSPIPSFLYCVNSNNKLQLLRELPATQLSPLMSLLLIIPISS